MSMTYPRYRACLAAALLAGVAGTVSCAGSDAAGGPVILLDVGGLSDIRSLRAQVTLNGRPAKAPVEIRESLNLVGLRLPDGETGPLSIVLEGLDGGGCVLKRGDAAATLTGEHQISLPVMLQPLPPYELTITPGGDGQGAVLVKPLDVSCDVHCQVSVPACTTVTLAATPSEGSIMQAWAGACTGGDACQFTMDGPREVGALFAQNLLMNPYFREAGPDVPPDTPMPPADHDSPEAPAAHWGLWIDKNGTIEAHREDSTKTGFSEMLHVKTSVTDTGLYQAFLPDYAGPACVQAMAWVLVSIGQVALGVGDIGRVPVVATSKNRGQWELLGGQNCTTLNNEIVIYSEGGAAEFYVTFASVTRK